MIRAFLPLALAAGITAAAAFAPLDRLLQIDTAAIASRGAAPALAAADVEASAVLAQQAPSH